MPLIEQFALQLSVFHEKNANFHFEHMIKETSRNETIKINEIKSRLNLRRSLSYFCNKCLLTSSSAQKLFSLFLQAGMRLLLYGLQ